MWLKKTVGITLVIALIGIFGLSFGAIAFTNAPTVTMLNPDGSTKQVTPQEAAKNPKLIEQSTSSSSDDSNSTPQAATDPSTTPTDSNGGKDTNTSTSTGSQSSNPSPNPQTPNPSPNPQTPNPAAPPAKPVISLSLSPSVITSGGSSTLQWTTTNSPTSCASSGAWSGSKPPSGSVNSGTRTTGSYTYTLTCSNAGGTASTSVTQTVNAPPINYCSGLSPCYGVSQMAQHASQAACWGYTTYRTGGSYPRTYDLVKAYNGTSKHRQANVGFWAKCGGDITHCVDGQAACGSVTKDHSADKLLQYSSPNGYYDSRKP